MNHGAVVQKDDGREITIDDSKKFGHIAIKHITVMRRTRFLIKPGYAFLAAHEDVGDVFGRKTIELLHQGKLLCRGLSDGTVQCTARKFAILL